MDHKIIAAVAASRENFERCVPHITAQDLSPEGWQVFRAIKRFYSRDAEAAAVDLELVQAAVARRLTNHKHSDMFEVYFQNVKAQDISAVNVVDEVLSAKREAAEMLLADAILSKQPEQVNQLLEQLITLRSKEGLETSVVEEYQSMSVEALTAGFDEAHLIKVAPASLNERLGGGVLRGHHILVAARPEAGKTAIVLTMLVGFVRCGLKTLYIGNEDPIKDIVMRTITSLSSMTKAEVLANPTRALDLAAKKGYHHAVFAGLNGGNLEDVRSLCTKHKPDVLIVDQIRNLTVSAENRTTQLEAVARGMRNIGREFQLVPVSVTQAGDSAHDKIILDMGDIDGSKTGIPGACDVMLMSGVNSSYEEQDIRMLTLCKNKVSGRHGSWTVNIDKAHSRIRDI